MSKPKGKISSLKQKKARVSLPFFLGIFVIFLPIIYLMLKNPEKVAAAWWDDTWLYRKEISFKNEGGKEQNKKIKVDIDTKTLIGEKKLKENCEDVRFTDSNNNPLRYFLDAKNGACNTSSTDFWILLPNIEPRENTLYFYYGNPTADPGTTAFQFLEETFSPTLTAQLEKEEENGSPPDPFWKFDEGYGTTAYDATGNSVDLEIFRAVWKQEDLCVSGKCLYFDGDGDFATRYDDDNLDFAAADNFTIEAWIRHSPQSSGQDVIVAKFESTGSDGGYKLLMESDGDITFGIDDDNSSFPEVSISSTAATYDDNQWHHVAAVKNGTTSVSLYIDGTLIGSQALSGQGTLANNDPFYVGIDGDGSSNDWLGFIDEVKVYDSARTEAEIKTDYLMGTETRGAAAAFGPSQKYLSDGLAGYWKTDEFTLNSCGTNTDACDASGNGTDLLAQGNATTASITGKFSNGSEYDGTGDYYCADDNDDAACDSATQLKITGDMTFTAWVNVDTTADEETIIYQGETGSDTEADNELYFLRFDTTSGNDIEYGHENGVGADNYNVFDTNLSADTWYHIAFTRNTATNEVKIFVNGSQTGSTYSYSNDPTGGSTGEFAVGSDDNGGDNFDGTIDDIRIYSKTLSPNEIRNLYNWAPGPTAHWKLDESDNVFIFDTTGNGNQAVHSAGIPDEVWTKYDNTIPANSDASSTNGRVPLGTDTKGDDARVQPGTIMIENGTYKMWYSGWDGTYLRIFYATSSDGLVWTKLNNTADGTCDTTCGGDGRLGLGTNGKGDDRNVAQPTVIKDGNTYKMWYSGHDGSNYRTFYATSSDGLTWTKVNNTSDGTCDTTCGGNGRVGLGTSGKGDDDHIRQPTVIKDSGTYKMWYSGDDGTPAIRTYYATSPDGLTWTKYDNTTPADSNTSSTNGRIPQGTAGTGDDKHASSLSPYYDGVVYRGFYSGNDDLNARAFYVTSPDGLTWTKETNTSHGTCDAECSSGEGRIGLGTAGKGDVDSINTKSSVLLDGNTFKMWYTGDAGSNVDRGYYTTMDTIGGTETWTDGKFGDAVQFDGTNDYLYRIDDPDFDFTASDRLTITGWFKHNTIDTNPDYILTKAQAGTNGGYKVYMALDGDIVFEVDDDSTWGPDDSATTTAATYDDNTWHHFAAVKNGTTGIYIYIDGVQIGSDVTIAATGTLANDDSIYIGVDDNGTSNPWAGALDDIRIYRYALTDTQITKAMNADHPAPGSPVGSTVMYFKFDEGYGTTANDSSPQNNDGDFYNRPPAWSNSGKIYGAANFDSSDFIRVNAANPSALNLTAPISLSAWVYPHFTNGTGAQANAKIISKPTTSNSNPWLIYSIGANNASPAKFVSHTSSGASGSLQTVTSTTSLTANQWFHVAMTYDGSNLKLFINGKKEATTSTSISLGTSTEPAIIGGIRDDYWTTDCWDGLIDEAKIYNVLLTEEQVKQDYNQGRAAVVGALSTDSSGNPSWSGTQEFCVPGDASTCNFPVALWKMDENTGTAIRDLSENRHTSTFANSPVWRSSSNCHEGSCLEFNSSDSDYIYATDTLDIPASDFTYSAWFKPFTLTGNPVILSKYPKVAAASYKLYIDSSVNKPAFHYCEGNNSSCTNYTITANSTVSANTWTHVSVTRSSSTAKIYINGALDNTATVGTGGADTDTIFWIGGIGGFSPVYFNGMIDKVTVYNYARSPAQIAWDYNSGEPVGWWKFDECTGITANDSSSGGNNGGISIGEGGSNTSAGTCSGSSGQAWHDGATGKRNYSLEFDGTDDYVGLSSLSGTELDFDDASQISISAWVKINGGSVDYIVELPESSDGGNGPGIHYNSTTIDYHMVTHSDTALTDVTTPVTTGQWYHVALTYDGTTLKGYKDGKLVGSHDVTLGTGIKHASYEFNIGRFGTWGGYFNGQIDEVKVFNYALTQNQVETLHGEGIVRFE